MTTTTRKVDPYTLAGRITDLLRFRAQADRGRAAFTFSEIATTLFSRFPGDGQPSKSEIKEGLRCVGLGGRMRIIGGKVVYRL